MIKEQVGYVLFALTENLRLSRVRFGMKFKLYQKSVNQDI